MAGRLGRLLEHDDRSRAFPFKAATRQVLQSVQHQSRIGILDQGGLGACTGFASIGAVGCDPFYRTIPDPDTLDAGDARDIYSLATEIDEFPGQWPTDDTGSSGLAAAKACQLHGLIAGYQHAFSLADALAALQAGPVITGVNWYSSFDNPDSTGMVTLPSGAWVRGGHEICADGYDAADQVVWFRNSWGPGWGLGGRFCMHVETWAQLLAEDGDVTVFVPLDEPAPQPDPTEADRQLVTVMDPWATSKNVWSRFTKAGKARTGYIDWKASRGL